jgi:hypothetical protein
MGIGDFFSGLWNGIKKIGQGIYNWGRGAIGGILGKTVGDPNSEDVNERLAAAGNKSLGILRGFVPAVAGDAASGNTIGVIDKSLHALDQL